MTEYPDPDPLALTKAYLNGWQEALHACPHVQIDDRKG